MKRTLALAAVSVAVLGGLTACGGDDGGGSASSSAYCDQLKEAKTAFDALDGQDVSKLEDAVSSVKAFAGNAPTEVRDDWGVLADTFDQLQQALSDAGVKLSDLAQMQNGQMPPGVDMKKLMEVGQKVQDLGGAQTEAAAKNIETDAKDRCDIELSSSSPSSDASN